MDNKRIYVDHSATTPMRKQVVDAMMPYFTENFGNASTVYAEGREAKKALNTARAQVAKAIGAKDDVFPKLMSELGENCGFRGGNA